MMATFAAAPSDLEEAVAYERDALEFLRATLFKQSEVPGGGREIALGDVDADGGFRGTLFLELEDSFSDGAVREALGRLRPLAFSAAFKLQDMIVEWVLRENGENAWPFVAKLNAYDKLLASSSIVEPPLFARWPELGRAFWELFRFLVPYRGSVIHTGGITLEADGTMSVREKTGRTLRFSAPEQGSYVRAMCIVAARLIAGRILDGYLRVLVENDLARLASYHRQSRLLARPVRLEALRVTVPPTHVVSAAPLAVMLDFDAFRRDMERSYPVGAGGQLFYPVTIRVADESREAVWDLPVEAVPQGVVVLREGNSDHDRFLRVTKKSSG